MEKTTQEKTKQTDNQNQRPHRGGHRGGPHRGGGRRGGRMQKAPQEFQEKALDLRRVTRVVAGGKRFRFRATVVIGDGKGRVGVGVGKGIDVATAIQKAKNDAKKRIIRVTLKSHSIPHQVEAKFSAARVIIKPATKGRGLKAGGAVRVVLSFAGIKDATAKCLGNTTNKLTNALATVEALKTIRTSR